MASYIADFYNDIFFEKSDTRIRGWFLMDSPIPIAAIILSYALFVKRLGPWMMTGRPAFSLERLIMLHNIAQIAINSHFVYVALVYVWPSERYSWICQMSSAFSGYDPIEDYVVGKFYLFMWSRLLDLLDTVFMVLKKNKHQVSFLHFYHHIFIALACWVCVKYKPGGNGHVIFFGTVNAFVHTIMYFYYFLTALDPSYKKSIWLKRRITELQLVQFFLLLCQQVAAIVTSDCQYPTYILAFFISQALLMIYLFSDFYIKAYIKQKKSKTS